MNIIDRLAQEWASNFSVSKTKNIPSWLGSLSDLPPILSFPPFTGDTETMKLSWLVRLRWAAISLFFVLAAPAYTVGLLNRSSIPIFIGIVGFLFLFNLLTQYVFVESKRRVGPLFLCFQLAVDVLALANLLFFSEGIENPFVGLLFLNAAIGGVLIQVRYSWPFIVLCHGLLIALQMAYFDVHRLEMTRLMSFSLFATHVLLFSTWMVMRSLGSFLERHFETQAKFKVQFEKQDRLRAVGALAAGFSHEFASPLNAAMLRLDRMERTFENKEISEVIPPPLKEDLQEAIASIHECEVVVHQMNSSQLDVRNFKLKKVKIFEFLEDVTHSWKTEHPSAKLNISVNSEGDVDIPPTNFAQVLLNLLDNSFEASPKTMIQLKFETKDGLAVLIVEDEGPGFHPKVIDRKGEPFVTTKPKGIGLGLYVSDLFAQSMGGELQLSNKSTQGGQVQIQWPLLISETTMKESTLASTSANS